MEAGEADGTAWEQREHPQFYETCTGRRLTGTFHSIRVAGLKPGTRYVYSIVGAPIVDDSYPYATDYKATCRMKGLHSVRTLDSSAKECRFSMVNDMHFDDAKYGALMKAMNRDSSDFVVLCGDIVSFSNSIDTVIRHTFRPIRNLCGDFPIFYARGNHETRGKDFHKLPKVFPTPTGEFYYSFREGPVAFLVPDAGEDKPDSSPEYSGQAASSISRLWTHPRPQQGGHRPDAERASPQVHLRRAGQIRQPFPDSGQQQHRAAGFRCHSQIHHPQVL